MTRRAEHVRVLVPLTLLALLAPALAGEWCENFESGSGVFWTQRSYSGKWEHTTYTDQSAAGGRMPQPAPGEDGVLMLRPPRGGDMASSRLVTPELVFSEGASIELTYWLWYNGAHKEVNFLLYRLINSVEEKEPFLNITEYTTRHEDHWSTIQAGISLSRGEKLRVAIYGYIAGNSVVSIALDRVVLHGVNDNKGCDEDRGVVPTEEPEGPEGPAFDFFCPTDYGLYMDPENCSFYYSCNAWLAIHMPCYTSLVFNPQTSMCDYLKYVPSCQ